jgi:hypothetical protein
MAGVLPKVKLYAFLGIIVTLINLSVFCIGLVEDSTKDINLFVGEETIPQDELMDYTENESVESADIGSFISAAGTGFIPFFGLTSILIFEELPYEIEAIVTIVIVMIGAMQLFLLVIIALNMIPKVLGSGFDV